MSTQLEFNARPKDFPVERHERLAPMTADDVRKVEDARGGIGWGWGCFGMIFLALLIAFAWQAPAIRVESAVFGGLVLAWVVLMPVLKRRKYNLDIAAGQKRVVVATILDKDVSVPVSNPRLSQPAFAARLEHRRNMSAPVRHVLQVDGNRYLVSREIWDQVQEGDLAEIHLAPRTEILLQPIARVNPKSGAAASEN